MNRVRKILSESKLSFKRQPASTGLSRVGSPHASVDIKLDGREVGTILPPSHRTSLNPSAGWKVQIHVKDPASGGGWKNVSFKKEFPSEAEAREWVMTRLLAAVETNKQVLHQIVD